MKKIISVLLAFALTLIVFSGCSSKNDNGSTTENGTQSGVVSGSSEYIAEDESVKHPIVKFTMKDGGTFTMKLYPEYAPETVDNFVTLVKSGFYDGLTFHRVMDDFMAQGGDPSGDGTGGSPKEIKGEFAANGFTDNTIEHKRGVVSMARRSGGNDTASSQFFICYTDYPSLNGQYAAFGYVFDGMDTVDSFLKVERTYDESGYLSRPVTPIIIAKAEVIA